VTAKARNPSLHPSLRLAAWTRAAAGVSSGRSRSVALDAVSAIGAPLRLSEKTGQQPMVAGRVAEFYDGVGELNVRVS
jgi:hypothetical protein